MSHVTRKVAAGRPRTFLDKQHVLGPLVRELQDKIDAHDDTLVSSVQALPEGNIKVGNSSGAPVDLIAKTSARILVGNGTTLVSVAVSGDATLSAAGAVTIAAAAVTGAKASAALRAKVIGRTIPTVPTAAGTLEVLVTAPYAGTLTAVRTTFKEALAAHDTNYLSFAIVNKGQAGAGSTAMLAATDANTTKITGGSAVAAYTFRALTIHGTGANLIVVAGDTLALQFIGAGTLANTLTEGDIQLFIDVAI